MTQSSTDVVPFPEKTARAQVEDGIGDFRFRVMQKRRCIHNRNDVSIDVLYWLDHIWK